LSISGSGSRRFYPEVESLRGVAALVVVVMHSFVLWPHFRMNDATTPVYQTLTLILWGAGGSSVTLFFVISGLVLRQSLDAKLDGNFAVTLGQFVIGRIFRIYPLVAAVILIWTCSAPWLPFPRGARYEWHVVLKNIALIDATIDWPTWSTRVEIGAIPLIFGAWALRHRLGTFALAGAAVAFAILAFWRALYGEDMIGRYIASFLLGMLIVDLPDSPTKVVPIRSLVPFVMVLLAAACIYARPYLSYHSQWSIVVETLCWTAFLYLLVRGNAGPLKKILLTPSLRLIGRISFSIFLVHFFVLFVLMRHLPESWLLPITAGDPAAESAVVLLITTAITIPLSIISYSAIEAPGIAAGRIIRQLLASGPLDWRRRLTTNRRPAAD
jgi:peptidoglycan/LPS O-acetylase OafA/YrhL